MASSAIEIIHEHIAGGEAKLIAHRKKYSGSGVYVEDFSERDERLLESVLSARDLLSAAQFGMHDGKFVEALTRWVAHEWGGFYDRQTLEKVWPLPKPAPRPQRAPPLPRPEWGAGNFERREDGTVKMVVHGSPESGIESGKVGS